MTGTPGLYAKSIYAALMAALMAVAAAFNGENGEISDAEWVGIVIAALTALGVYLFPNSSRSDEPARRDGVL